MTDSHLRDRMLGLGAELARASAETQTRTRELDALLQGAREVLANATFEQAAQAIFHHCCQLTGATSGYVALFTAEGTEKRLLFLEAGGLPCGVDPERPLPIRGLRACAYHEQRAVYRNDLMDGGGPVALRNGMFAPLVLEGRAVGLIGLANKDGDFDDHDAKIAAGFGELAAIALQSSRRLDERVRAEQAQAEARHLSGLIPICASCKRILADDGDWQQAEIYMRDRCGVQFSHHICPDCARRLYPEVELSEGIN